MRAEHLSKTSMTRPQLFTQYQDHLDNCIRCQELIRQRTGKVCGRGEYLKNQKSTLATHGGGEWS